jgi:hypothetical protein
MYVICWVPNVAREVLVEGVSLEDLPELLLRMKREFPGAYAMKVL